MRRKDATRRPHERGHKRRSDRRKLSAATLFAMIFGASLIGGSAEAAPGGDATVEAVSLNDVPHTSSAAAAVPCPPGKRIVGGGVDTTGSVDTFSDYVVEVSGPLDDTGLTANTEDGDIARFWYASIFNNSGGLRDFKVFALCSADSDATVEVEPLNGVPSFTSAATTATCPSGRRVVGGGVNTTGPVTTGWDYQLELSGPQDETASTASTEDGDVARHWYGSIHHATGSPRDFKIIALCSEASDATIEVQLLSGVASGTSSVATCPPGRRALGGGINTTGPVTTMSDYTVELSGPLDETSVVVTTDDGDIARQWHASIWNSPVTGGPKDFKVFALCASDPAGPTGGGGTGGGGGGVQVGACAGQAATIVGTPGADTLSGTTKADVMAGLGGNDVLKGLGANDRICGGPGKDRLSGGSGADYLTGGPAADRIFGGPGRDRIIGGPGNDSCAGGPAVDKASGC